MDNFDQFEWVNPLPGIIREPVPRSEFLIKGGPWDYFYTFTGTYRIKDTEFFEKQVGAIDSELLSLFRRWGPEFPAYSAVAISVGSYPRREKIEGLKNALREALASSYPYTLDTFRKITRLLWGRIPKTSEIPSLVEEYEGPLEDPYYPDAPILPSNLVRAEGERRLRWRDAWREYTMKLLGSPEKAMFIMFELPTSPRARYKISPRLRLPTGEYLEPVVMGGTISPVPPVVPQPQPPVPPVVPPVPTPVFPIEPAPVVPQPQPWPVTPEPETPVTDDTTVPVSEEKKDEKKAFPWWLVIVIGVVVLFFIMKD